MLGRITFHYSISVVADKIRAFQNLVLLDNITLKHVIDKHGKHPLSPGTEYFC